MRRILPALLVLAAPALAAAAAPAPPFFPGARSLLWIGAHPDDEVIAAPLLARSCLVEGLRCTFLVLTHGEAGPCVLPQGCGAVGPRRVEEMRRAARLFGAWLVLWDLGDGGGGESPLGRWEAKAGGHDALVAKLRRAIAAADPDVVLAFDPRHGSTCHPDHRAAGDLTREALDGDPERPLFLLETEVTSQDGRPHSFRAAAGVAAGVVGFDATAIPPGSAAAPWQFLVADAEIHRTQFDAATLRLLRRFPATSRVVFLAPASSALAAELPQNCD